MCACSEYKSTLMKETTESNKKAVPPHVGFNFAMGLIHGILFQTGMGFSAPMSVLPVFLNHFTHSQGMIGLFSSLMGGGGVLPQLFVANRLQSRPRKKPVLVLMIWIRAAIWLLLGLFAYFCPPGQSVIVLVALLILLFGFSFAGGAASIPFTDIWAKALPPTLRGRFFGHRQLWGSLMAIGAGYAVKRILANPNVPFPKNYAFLFLLSFIFIAMSYIALSSVREPKGQVSTKTHRMSVFVKKSLRLLSEDRNFGILIATQLAVGFGIFTLPFYVLYGKNELHMATEQVGILVGAQMAGGIVANLLCAQLSDHVGNRIVIILTAATAALIPLLALLSAGVGWTLLIVVFVLIGFSASAGPIGFTNYLLEIAPEQLRPTYIALRGTLMGLTMFLPILGGLLIDAASYEAAFVTALVVAIIGLLQSTTLKPVRNAVAGDKG